MQYWTFGIRFFSSNFNNNKIDNLLNIIAMLFLVLQPKQTELNSFSTKITKYQLDWKLNKIDNEQLFLLSQSQQYKFCKVLRMSNFLIFRYLIEGHVLKRCQSTNKMVPSPNDQRPVLKYLGHTSQTWSIAGQLLKKCESSTKLVSCCY